MQAMRRRIRAGRDRRSKIGLGLGLILLLWTSALSSQAAHDDSVLDRIHKRLASSEKLTYHKPIVFIGKISRLGPVPQGICKSAIAQEVEFTISRPLFGDYSDFVLRTGYVNCSWKPLPSPPFTLHATVIVYCEQFHHSVQCLDPVEFSDKRLKKIESWVAAVPHDLAIQRDRGDTVLWALHEPLQDSERLAKRQGFVFVGEVSRNEKIRQRRCASGVEQKVAYRVSQVLWNFASSLVGPGYEVSKGFIDCRRSPLTSFGEGAKVIAYCEAEPGQGYNCNAPVLFTDDRLGEVQLWVDELRHKEGDPALLQIHHRLRDSLELGPSRPLVLFGQITRIDPPSYINTVTIPRYMHVTPSRLLWGYNKAPEVLVDCPFRDCSAVAVGAKVIAYCELLSVYEGPPGRCSFASAAFTDENVSRVEEWVKQARRRQPALILERIRKSLAAADRSDAGRVPAVYRGHVESIGKADNGVPLEHFIDTTGQQKKAVNLIFWFPYGRTPPAVEIGKPMITFCYQKNDVCYIGEEVVGIIADSDETFREIQRLIGPDR
jgi:hypothetical protein